MKLVFTWIQGCGKGTQAKLLAEKYGFESTGMWDEFRKVVKSGSKLWEEIKAIIESGYLVWDDLGAQVMRTAIENASWVENMIFDAFIRLPWNKEVFDSYLSDYKVVFFNLSEEKAKKRLLGRMFNKATWETYMSGVTHDPVTGDELIRRADDDEASILKRIEEYVKYTLPIVDVQRAEWRVIEINADQAIENVFAELEEKLQLTEIKDYCSIENTND